MRLKPVRQARAFSSIEKVAVALGQDSTDVFRALLAKLIEEPEEKQTFDRLLEMAEKFAAKHE